MKLEADTAFDWKLRFAFFPVTLRTGRIWLAFYWSRFAGTHYEVEPLVKPMPNMLAAMHTDYSDSSRSRYAMHFEFRNLHDLQFASNEWRQSMGLFAQYAEQRRQRERK